VCVLSQKIAISTPWMVIGNSEYGKLWMASGDSKAKIVKGKYKAKLELWRGGSNQEGVKPKTIHEGGMDVFWNNMLRLDATDKFCTC